MTIGDIKKRLKKLAKAIDRADTIGILDEKGQYLLYTSEDIQVFINQLEEFNPSDLKWLMNRCNDLWKECKRT